MTHPYDIIIAIVNTGMEDEVIAQARDSGALCLAVVHARGTVTSEMLDMLGLEDKRRSIVTALSRTNRTPETLRDLHRHFQMGKAGHGIVFSMPASGARGAAPLFRLRDEIREKAGLQPLCAPMQPNPDGEEDTVSYEHELIYVIVKSGFADEAMEAAKAAGASGGTIIHARGVGIHESAKLFGIAIEPEKDVLIIVSKQGACEAILQGIVEKVGLKTPGQGIAFTVPVTRVMGITHDSPEQPQA
jgi:nitrogen regulatory protein PII